MAVARFCGNTSTVSEAVTLVLSHDDCKAHKPPPGHPESPARHTVALQAALRVPGVKFLEAPLVKPNQITRVHSRRYYDSIIASQPDDEMSQLDPDTFISEGSVAAALRAAGAAVHAVDLVVNKQALNAFCAIRPPGHHAEPENAMGFCLFNNVAIAAMHALKEHNIEKVAIIDFDVHHGNGTQAAFDAEGRVCYFSTHQRSLYPGTGFPEDVGVGNIHNYMLPPNTGSSHFRKVVSEQLLPSLRRCRPDIILISAGFDAHKNDPLAQLNFEADDYGWITTKLCELAAKYSQNRIVSMLEGGYDLKALDECVFSHVTALSDAAAGHN